MAASKSPSSRREPTLAEDVCLAVICERPTHGWEVGSALSPEGDIGQVWTLSRPLTYRAVDQLVEQRLVRRTATTTGHGRQRQLLRASARGVRRRDEWVSTPVEHLRDVRTELLLKLLLAERVGMSRLSILAAQRVAFADQIDALTMGCAPDDLVSLWRRESARAVRRFLTDALAAETARADDDAVRPPAGTATAQRSRVRLSARNQLVATVVSITIGDVMATVTAELAGGQQVMSAITKASVDELDLATGDEVIIIIKSTEIIIAKP